jgi:hypothetical protein
MYGTPQDALHRANRQIGRSVRALMVQIVAHRAAIGRDLQVKPTNIITFAVPGYRRRKPRHMSGLYMVVWKWRFEV